MINISDCPKTGLKRKVDYDFYWNRITKKEVIISCVVKRFNQDDTEFTSAGIVSYLRELKATTDTPVNPNTGEVLSEWSEGAISEYDYYSYGVANMSIILPEMIEQIILLRDSQGKFN